LPLIEIGAVAGPTEQAANGVPVPETPAIRSIQPVRRSDPGAARSISSMASKCDMVGSCCPTAWTNASWPASHSGTRSESAGCIPNVASSWVSCEAGIAIVGRLGA